MGRKHQTACFTTVATSSRLEVAMLSSCSHLPKQSYAGCGNGVWEYGQPVFPQPPPSTHVLNLALQLLFAFCNRHNFSQSQSVNSSFCTMPGALNPPTAPTTDGGKIKCRQCKREQDRAEFEKNGRMLKACLTCRAKTWVRRAPTPGHSAGSQVSAQPPWSSSFTQSTEDNPAPIEAEEAPLGDNPVLDIPEELWQDVDAMLEEHRREMAAAAISDQDASRRDSHHVPAGGEVEENEQGVSSSQFLMP